ncbi:MAG TPA: complex I NDUFA9 subunit family protein [Thiobacillaceae bacterium]|nr:complex I NDUFA9 subunit family protein [Thiobacillaceae bacterium]HNU63427.1 complex I NDUFA9 subunit family protein [Thiobacillaceae bacterium]
MSTQDIPTRPTVCVFGGGGFVGHHLSALLARQGWRVLVPTRRRESVKALAVLPTVEVVEADIHDPAVLKQLLHGAAAAINLVGLLHETATGPVDTPRVRRGSFRYAHVELPRKIIQACFAAGVPRLLHMSALGADPISHSAYQRSKAAGEETMREAQKHLQVTIFRPSVIFGPGDRFLSLFSRLLRLSPVVPLAGGKARFQPVYVQDVAQAFASALLRPDSIGRTYNLCGPRIYTLAELLRLTARELGLRRWIIPLGHRTSYWFARIMELKPGRKLMTRDNLYAMLTDNVCGTPPDPVFACDTTLESVIGYLHEQDPRRAYTRHRAIAGR